MDNQTKQIILKTIFLLQDLEKCNKRSKFGKFKNIINKSLFNKIKESIPYSSKSKKPYSCIDNKLTEIDNTIIELNSLFDMKDKIVNIQSPSNEIIMLQAKKYITPKQMQKIYNISISQQKQYRSRIHNALPYHQKVRAGNITYITKEVENWIQNQYS